jgi:hypothetical protein
MRTVLFVSGGKAHGALHEWHGTIRSQTVHGSQKTTFPTIMSATWVCFGERLLSASNRGPTVYKTFSLLLRHRGKTRLQEEQPNIFLLYHRLPCLSRRRAQYNWQIGAVTHYYGIPAPHLYRHRLRGPTRSRKVLLSPWFPILGSDNQQYCSENSRINSSGVYNMRRFFISEGAAQRHQVCWRTYA